MKRRRISVLFILFCLLAVFGSAQQKDLPDLSKTGMVIPWSDFKILLKDLKLQPTPTPIPQPPVDQAFTTCRIKATVDPKGESLEVEMRYAVDVLRSDRWVEIRVAPADLALDSVLMDGSPARLYLRGGFSCAAVNGAGRHTFVLKSVVKISQSQGRWSIDLRYPPAPAASLELRVPNPKLVFEISPGISLKTETSSDGSLLRAALDGGGRARISWFKKIEEDQRETTLIAETTTALDIGEGSFRGTMTVSYTIHGRGTQHFELEIPDNLTVLDITGHGLKRWQPGPAKDHRIPLSIDLDFTARGTWRFQMQFEGLLSENSTDFEIPDFFVRNTRRERGFLAVAAASNVEITPTGKMKNVALVDPSEMPPGLQAGAGSEVLFVFKYLHHPIEARLEVKKHRDLQVKRTIVEDARLLSFVNAQGRRLHSATYKIRNNRKQFLSVDLPKGAHLWGAFREGKPIKASQNDEGAILVPLKKTALNRQGKLQAFDIRLVYAEAGSLRGGPGHQSFKAPKIDVDILDLRWQLFLPHDRRYFGFGGDLEMSPRQVRTQISNSPTPRPSPPGKPEGIKEEELNYLQAQAIPSQVADENFWKAPVRDSEARGMLPVNIEVPRQGLELDFSGKLLAPEEAAGISFFYAPANWHIPQIGAGTAWALGFLAAVALGVCLILKRRLFWMLGAAILLVLFFLVASAHHTAYLFGILAGALFSLLIRWMRSREDHVGEGF